MKKTNAMRMLDRAKIPYEVRAYEVDENDLSGEHVASQLGEDFECVFKTLVLKGERTGYIVCCIPVHRELDLKKAAKAAGDKRAEMLPLKELLPVTGYIRGGCSPVGMKKHFPTFIHQSAQAQDHIAVSAGVRGAQIILSPQDLQTAVQAQFADLIHGE